MSIGCELCDKSFKTERSRKNHLLSKTHYFKKLEREFENLKNENKQLREENENLKNENKQNQVVISPTISFGEEEKRKKMEEWKESFLQEWIEAEEDEIKEGFLAELEQSEEEKVMDEEDSGMWMGLIAETDEEKERCPICYDEEKECSVECERCHNKWCEECDRQLQQRVCPMCRVVLPVVRRGTRRENLNISDFMTEFETLYREQRRLVDVRMDSIREMYETRSREMEEQGIENTQEITDELLNIPQRLMLREYEEEQFMFLDNYFDFENTEARRDFLGHLCYNLRWGGCRKMRVIYIIQENGRKLIVVDDLTTFRLSRLRRETIERRYNRNVIFTLFNRP